MNSRFKLATAAVAPLVVAIIAGLFLVIGTGNNLDRSQNTEPSIEVNSNEELSILVSTGEREFSYTVDYVEGETVLTTINRLDENSDKFSFETESFDFGVFITTINNYKADSFSEYWAIKVNGENASVGITELTVKPDDELSFSLETF